MAKGSPPSMSSNGGILGSGVFGMVGSVVQCKADDNSWYCSLTKLVSGLIMILFLIFLVISIIYLFLNRSYYYKMLFIPMK